MADQHPLKEIKKFEKDLEEAILFFKGFLAHPFVSIEHVPHHWDWAVILIVVNALAAVCVLVSCLFVNHSFFNTLLQVVLFPLVLTLFQFVFGIGLKLYFEHKLDREIDIKFLFILISASNIPFILLKSVSGWDLPIEYFGLTITGFFLYKAMKFNLKIPDLLAQKTALTAVIAILSLGVASYYSRSKTEMLYEKIASPQDVNKLEKEMQNSSQSK